MQLHITDRVPLWHALYQFDIKQNYTVKQSLIDRNNSNKKPNELKLFHLVMSIIQY